MAILNAPQPEHFDAEEFSQFIRDHGMPALWRRSVTCPCLSDSSGQPAVDCPYCFEGILWDAGTQIVVVAPGRSRRDTYDQFGYWMQGFVNLTFPDVTPGHFDRIDATNAEMAITNERQIRGAVDASGRSRERLRFRHAIAVESAVAIVDGTLFRYDVDADLTIGPAGEIRWTDDDHGPPRGAQYTMRYRAHPAWIIWAPGERDEGGNKMPYRAIAQRLDFFGRPVVGGDGASA